MILMTVIAMGYLVAIVSIMIYPFKR